MLMAHPNACCCAYVCRNGGGRTLTSPIARSLMWWHCPLLKPGSRYAMPECACEILFVIVATELVCGAPPVLPYHACSYAPIRVSWLASPRILSQPIAPFSLNPSSIAHLPENVRSPSPHLYSPSSSPPSPYPTPPQDKPPPSLPP